MRFVYVFFSALMAAGISYAADATPLHGIQWAHTTRVYCASVAPSPCAPSLTVIIYSRAPDLGYRVTITYKHSGDPSLTDALILYSDKVNTNAFQGAILRYDPCLLDSGDIAVLGIEVTPLAVSGPTLKSSEKGRIYLE